MNDIERAKHERTRLILKIVGVILVVAGLTCAIIGFVDFFKSMSDRIEPKYFFLSFIGIPLFAVGMGMSMFGFRREITTYVKNESVPVINDMSRELAPGISSVAKAVNDGVDDVVCECGTHNARGDKFCKNCGKSLVTTCPNCGKEVASDSKFCTSCGKELDKK